MTYKTSLTRKRGISKLYNDLYEPDTRELVTMLLIFFLSYLYDDKRVIKNATLYKLIHLNIL